MKEITVESQWQLTSMSALAFKNDLPDPVRSNGFLVPETYETKFIFTDIKGFEKSVWSVLLVVKLREAGTPSALEIKILGLTKSEPLEVNPRYFVERLPVESWQIDLCNKNLNEMLKLSLYYGIEFLRYDEDPKTGEWFLKAKVQKESLGTNEWKLGSKGLEGIDPRKLKKQIEKVLDRRSLSNEDHLKVAEIYLDEIKRAKATKTKAKTSKRIAEYFGLTDDGADYRIKLAREKGFLKDTKKVSAPKAGSKKPTNRKEKKNEPTQNRRTKGRNR